MRDIWLPKSETSVQVVNGVMSIYEDMTFECKTVGIKQVGFYQQPVLSQSAPRDSGKPQA